MRNDFIIFNCVLKILECESNDFSGFHVVLKKNGEESVYKIKYRLNYFIRKFW